MLVNDMTLHWAHIYHARGQTSQKESVMFTFKKNLTIAMVSAALISMSGSAFATSDWYDYGCDIPEPVFPQVCFYTGSDYTGNWYCESGARTVNKLDKAPWKDNIESIKLLDGASVYIYNQYDRLGERELLDNSDPSLDSDFFNKVRSYRTLSPEIEENPRPSWWWDEMCRYQY